MTEELPELYLRDLAGTYYYARRGAKRYWIHASTKWTEDAVEPAQGYLIRIHEPVMVRAFFEKYPLPVEKPKEDDMLGLLKRVAKVLNQCNGLGQHEVNSALSAVDLEIARREAKR